MYPCVSVRLHAYTRVHTHMCSLWRPEEGIRYPGAGVGRSWEPPDIDSGCKPPFLSKGSSHFQLSNLFSPPTNPVSCPALRVALGPPTFPASQARRSGTALGPETPRVTQARSDFFPCYASRSGGDPLTSGISCTALAPDHRDFSLRLSHPPWVAEGLCVSSLKRAPPH